MAVPVIQTVGGAAALGVAPTAPKPKNAAEAAKQFEAVLIAQLLHNAHESGADAGLGGGQDSSADTMWDVAAQQFSQLLANNGGLGLGKLIAAAMSKNSAGAPTVSDKP